MNIGQAATTLQLRNISFDPRNPLSLREPDVRPVSVLLHDGDVGRVLPVQALPEAILSHGDSSRKHYSYCTY